MTDENTPDQPSQSGQQENWKARYDGLVLKVQQLTLENRNLTDQLVAKSSDSEQLRSQLSMKDMEKQSAVGERDRQIFEFKTAQSQSQGELNELRSLKTKLEVIKKLGKPQVVRVMDSVPALSDPAAIESVFASLAAFADDAANEREKQLKAGITPAFSSQQNAPAMPGNEDDWTAHIQSLPLGSKERKDAHDKFWTWASQKYAT